jgi:antitoxin (DNA-binding transcriptional repressor) of toxin-antitoxin stability system
MILFAVKRWMSMHQVNIEEAPDNLSELIDAEVAGEEVVISKDSRHTVKLAPVQNARPQPQFGSARDLMVMADNFDEPLEEFEEYAK